MPHIIAVIVTHNRVPSLLESLSAIQAQSVRPDRIVIVDNAADPILQEQLLRFEQVYYLPSHINLGGAGGFALGILIALSLGAEWIWLADDDGSPADPTVLETLYTTALAYQLGEVSPLVIDAKNPTYLAFPLRQGLTWHRKAADIQPKDGRLLPGIASLFNGALFHRSTVLDIGVPDLRYFIRGDEVEIHRRLVKSGIPFGTCVLAHYLHPSGSDEFLPIMRAKAHAQYPDNDIKRFFTYRNRGLLLAQPGMMRLCVQEWVRFSWFFLINRRDITGYIHWMKLHKLGRREAFQRHFAEYRQNFQTHNFPSGAPTDISLDNP